MPIYEYKCSGCGLTVEERRAVESRDEAVDCDNCGTTFTRAFATPHTWGPTRGLS